MENELPINFNDAVRIGFELLTYFLTSIGYSLIFKKCSKSSILAFIPAVRDYEMSTVAEREEAGRTLCVLYAGFYLTQFAGTIISNTENANETLVLLLVLLMLTIGIAILLCSVQIYMALCDMFGKKKLWTVLWLLIPWIPAIIWGLSKNTVPKRVNGEDYRRAAALSGATVDQIAHGVTINLNERTAIDFIKKKTLLKDIHLSIPTGRMVLLLGGSGAGKTTFLNALTGYEKADATVTLDGQDVYSNYDSMKYNIGFVPQQDLMRGNDTVNMTLRNAATIRLPRNMKYSERRDRIKEMFDTFGLYSVRGSLVNKLSGGQRKRLSIAMEFVSDPSLFILDEPDSGLDGVVARKLFKSLREIADEGKIVLVITHTPDRVIDLFDDVIVLAKDRNRTGRLAYYGPVKNAYEFFGKKTMEDIVLSVNQKDEGGEGLADDFVEKYTAYAFGGGGQ